MARQDPYGEGLLQYSTESFADSGGEIIDQFLYDPEAPTFESEVERVVSAAPEALVIIGFEETAQIMTSLFEAGVTADTTAIYLVDGNVGNALGEQLPAGSMVGIKGTLPQAETHRGLPGTAARGRSGADRLQLRPGDVRRSRSSRPSPLPSPAPTIRPRSPRSINGVTRDGEVCTTFADCIALIEAGTDIDYDGPAGPMTFGPEGEPTEASYAILCYDENNVAVGGDCETTYQFATI